MAHRHNGVDIEIKSAVETLKNGQKIWRRPVHMQAQINDEMVPFSYDGQQSQQQRINADTPKPANRV